MCVIIFFQKGAVMITLENLANKYIKKDDSNLFLIEGYDGDSKDIRKTIIREKNAISDKIDFQEDDFVLVRIVNPYNFPINFKFYPLDERNCFDRVENPFIHYLQCFNHNIDGFRDLDIGIEHKDVKHQECELVSFRYRNTKHFAINGLASDIYIPLGQKVIFSNGNAIIIEPLKEKLKDNRLVNLNPIDTFFDLKDSSMDISDNAIFLFEKKAYFEYVKNEKIKEGIKNRRVYLYDGSPSLATDLALMSLGYIPLHSFQQCMLKPENFIEDGSEISDQLYLEQLKKYMEYLNNAYLNTTYLKVPIEFQKKRLMRFRGYIDNPGLLHCETKYIDEECKRNLDSDLKTYEEYLHFIFSYVSFISKKEIEDICYLVKKDVIENAFKPFQQTFYSVRKKYDECFIRTLLELQYPTFKNFTEEFNAKRLMKIDVNRQG